jgi:hypothetical protein
VKAAPEGVKWLHEMKVEGSDARPARPFVWLRRECRVLKAPELERRLVATFDADVEGYGRLMHSDEEGTMTLSSRGQRSVAEQLGYVGALSAIRRQHSQNWAVCFAGEVLAIFSIFTQGGCCTISAVGGCSPSRSRDSAVPGSARLRLEN